MKKRSELEKPVDKWFELFTPEEVLQIKKDIEHKRDELKDWEERHPIQKDYDAEDMYDTRYDMVYGGNWGEYDLYLDAIKENKRVSSTAIFELMCMYSIRQDKQKLNEQEKSILEKTTAIRKQEYQKEEEEENEQIDTNGETYSGA